MARNKMRVMRDDIPVKSMIEIMTYLDTVPPITADYTAGRTDNGVDLRGYKSQKEHMIVWFLGQSAGSRVFSYTRQVSNNSSKATYNRFANPYGLLWLAEALGEDSDTLVRAMDAALSAGKVSPNRRCGAFRKIIPFDRILALLGNPTNWRIDKQVEMFLDIKPNNRPTVALGMREEFNRALHKEGIYLNEKCISL